MSQGSRHCPTCNVRWPLGSVLCPACNTSTTICVGLAPTKTPFHAAEALFERRYQQREERRIAEGHIAPEAIGKREARAIIERERAVKELESQFETAA